jgi:hypothetical protein
MGKQIKQEVTGDRQVNQLQATSTSATQQLRDGPFGQGNLVTGVKLPDNVATKVNSGLGQPIQGWVLCRVQNSTYGGSVVETTSDDSSVTFLSYGASTVSVWFF